MYICNNFTKTGKTSHQMPEHSAKLSCQWQIQISHSVKRRFLQQRDISKERKIKHSSSEIRVLAGRIRKQREKCFLVDKAARYSYYKLLREERRMEMNPNSEASFPIPKISATSSIAELMKALQCSVEVVRDFQQVENILTARENSLKLKIENLEMSHYWAKEATHKNEALSKVKEECRTNESLLKLDGALREEELQRSKKECAKLKEEISLLTMQGRALNERVKIREDIFVKERKELTEKISRSTEDLRKLDEERISMEERYAELSVRCLQKTSEKDEVVYKLNEMMNELKNRNLEKLKLEEKLQRSQKDHDSSKEEIIGLMKRTEECYAKNYNEYLKKIEEKDEMILHLNKKINELENQNSESEQIAEMYKSKVKSSELMVAQKNGVIEELKWKKSELRCREEKYVKSVEELNEKLHMSQMAHDKSKEEMIRLIEDRRGGMKRIEEKAEMILQLNKKIKELENQRLESEHIAEMYELKIKSFDFIVAQKSEEVYELKRKKSEADDVVQKLRCKLLEADKNLEEHRRRFETLKARVRMVEHGVANVLNTSVNDLKNQVDKVKKKSATVEEGAMRENKNGRRRENDGLGNQDMGHFQDESNLMNGTAEDEMNGVLQRDHSEPVKKHLEVAGHSSVMANIIEIYDRDDEELGQEGSLGISMSKRKKSTNGNENSEIFPTAVQKEKRRRELPESFLNDSCLKSLSAAIDQQFHGIDVGASIDSDDESITSSRIDDIIASLVKKETSSVKAFEEENGLC